MIHLHLHEHTPSFLDGTISVFVFSGTVSCGMGSVAPTSLKGLVSLGGF